MFNVNKNHINLVVEKNSMILKGNQAVKSWSQKKIVYYLMQTKAMQSQAYIKKLNNLLNCRVVNANCKGSSILLDVN